MEKPCRLFSACFSPKTCALHLPQCTCPLAVNSAVLQLSVFFMNCIVSQSAPSSLSPPLSITPSFFAVLCALQQQQQVAINGEGNCHFLFSAKFQLWTNMTTPSMEPQCLLEQRSSFGEGEKQNGKCNICKFFRHFLPLAFASFLSLSISLSFCWQKSLCSTFMGVGACTRAAVSFLARHGPDTIHTKL